MAEQNDRAKKIEGLRASAVALEAQRGMLGDAVVDAALAAILAQIDELEKGAEPGDEVRGDKVSGDKVAGGKTQIDHADQVNIYRGDDPAGDQEALRAYLRATARFGNRLPLAPLDPRGQESAYISLAQVFVGLDAGMAIRQVEDTERAIIYTAALGHIHDNRRLILLGDPGSGKTTLLRFISLCLAQAALAPDKGWLERFSWSRQMVKVDELTKEIDVAPDLVKTGQLLRGVEGDSEPVFWTADAPIPIFITLRDFAREEFDARSPLAIWRHLARWLESSDLTGAVEALRRRALAGQVIFLLDGVDEVPLAQRAAVWRAIEALNEGPYGGNRWLATCRVLSFVESEAPPGAPAQTLQPLNQVQIEAFIASWYGALAEAGELGREQAQNLTAGLEAAARRPRLRPLAQNPMLLTIMALVQTYHGTLPEERAKLYQACVETLLLRWQRHKETAAEGELLPEPLLELGAKQADLERLLWQIAWSAHAGAAGREEAADIPESQVMAIARQQLGSYARAEAFLAYTEQRAHLLVGRGGAGERIYAFPHRTFQEYLAACHLAAGRRFPQEAARLAQDPGLWRETLNLAAGTLVFNQNNREKALDGVSGVLPARLPAAEDEAGWNRVWLAGEMMAVAGREAAEADEVGRELLPRVRKQLAALLDGGRLAPRARAEAGDALGRLGDPRPGVCDRLPEMIPIPEGTFLMGDERHEIELTAFATGRYPVTNAQYRYFVEDGGYSEKWRDCWTAEGWRYCLQGKLDRTTLLG